MIGEGGKMTIVYSLDFELPDDQALARVILLEFQTSMRKVSAPVTAKYHDKDVPDQLADKFPNVKLEDYSNGFLVICK